MEMMSGNESCVTESQRRAAKLAAIEKACANMTALYGHGNTKPPGEGSGGKIDVLPTGLLCLDYVTGLGGYPRGRVVEVVGPPYSGKTAIALHAMLSAQREGGLVAYIEGGNELDVAKARRMGIDLAGVLYSHPETAEEALDVCGALLSTGLLDLVVIDNVNGFATTSELATWVGADTSNVTTLHELLGQRTRELSLLAEANHCTLLLVNQERNALHKQTTGDMCKSCAADRDLFFYSSLRLWLTENGEPGPHLTPRGIGLDVKVIKNSLGPVDRTASLEQLYEEGH